jgi:hypothetical protein
VLQRLRALGCEWDAAAWPAAAAAGCEAVLEWLHEAGCPKPVSSWAVGECELSEACVPTTQAPSSAAREKRVRVRHSPCNHAQVDAEAALPAYRSAVSQGDVSTLRALTRLGLPFKPHR